MTSLEDQHVNKWMISTGHGRSQRNADEFRVADLRVHIRYTHRETAGKKGQGNRKGPLVCWGSEGKCHPQAMCPLKVGIRWFATRAAAPDTVQDIALRGTRGKETNQTAAEVEARRMAVRDTAAAAEKATTFTEWVQEVAAAKARVPTLSTGTAA